MLKCSTQPSGSDINNNSSPFRLYLGGSELSEEIHRPLGYRQQSGTVIYAVAGKDLLWPEGT